MGENARRRGQTRMNPASPGRGRNGRHDNAHRRGVQPRGTAKSPARALKLGAVVVPVLLLGALAWFAWGGQLPTGTPEATRNAVSGATHSPIPTRNVLEPLTLAGIQRRPHLVFQNVVRNHDYAKVSLVPLDAPAGLRLATDLVCERVHFAGGRGLCGTAEHGAESSYFAVPFGTDFAPGNSTLLDGSPSFVRVSPDGRHGAITLQLRPPTPEAPLAPMQTNLIDMASGNVVADLGDFSVTRDGAEISDPEMDVWGVTFRADSDSFLASLRTAGNTYLVEGTISTSRMAVIASNASAPSVSPDGGRVAYAKLISNIGPTWRFHVLDLATMRETALAESKSIDDQPEWLNDEELLYGLATDVWSVRADGSGQPRPFLFGGLSPSVVR